MSTTTTNDPRFNAKGEPREGFALAWFMIWAAIAQSCEVIFGLTTTINKGVQIADRYADLGLSMAELQTTELTETKQAELAELRKRLQSQA